MEGNVPHAMPVKAMKNQVHANPARKGSLARGDWLRVVGPRLSWRLYCRLWDFRKRLYRVVFNLRDRPAPLSQGSFGSLGAMVDWRRIAPGAIPVVINNFNRLETLRVLVDWLMGVEGPAAIIIVDNASTYPPLKEYYRTLRNHPRVQLVRLGFNSGLEGMEDIGRELCGIPKYVVTDPDLVPYPGTPRDILRRMAEFLDRHPEINHVGASLEIADIPDFYPLRSKVLEWESQFWPPRAKPLGDDGVEAWVDSTFAMYRGTSDVSAVTPAARLNRPYTLKHADWYIDPARMSAEQDFYRGVCSEVASWSVALNRGLDRRPYHPRGGGA